jgi:hypothetical protein
MARSRGAHDRRKRCPVGNHSAAGLGGAEARQADRATIALGSACRTAARTRESATAARRPAGAMNAPKPLWAEGNRESWTAVLKAGMLPLTTERVTRSCPAGAISTDLGCFSAESVRTLTFLSLRLVTQNTAKLSRAGDSWGAGGIHFTRAPPPNLNVVNTSDPAKLGNRSRVSERLPASSRVCKYRP